MQAAAITANNSLPPLAEVTPKLPLVERRPHGRQLVAKKGKETHKQILCLLTNVSVLAVLLSASIYYIVAEQVRAMSHAAESERMKRYIKIYPPSFDANKDQFWLWRVPYELLFAKVYRAVEYYGAFFDPVDQVTKIFA